MSLDIPLSPAQIPWLTTGQMVEVDRRMIEDFRIELIQMMENAGRNLAALARARFLGGDPKGTTVVVLAGPGGNGGGALAAARRLHGWGARVEVFLSRPEGDLTPVPSRQLDILSRIGVSAGSAAEVEAAPRADLVIDGVVGYSLRGAPRGAAADLIRWANGQAAPVLALDVPSGLDATSGRAHDPAVRATATMTLALPKWGLGAAGAREHVGELYLADIGVPPSLYSIPSLCLTVGPIFATGDIVRLW
jgi:NAD(P)H-hydrate epimerase